MNDIINYIIKEIVISTKNQDWARLKSITEYKRKAMLSVDNLKLIDNEVQKELNQYKKSFEYFI